MSYLGLATLVVVMVGLFGGLIWLRSPEGRNEGATHGGGIDEAGSSIMAD